MSNENIEAHLQTSQHMKKLGEIVESTIDTQLSLSKRLARTENELRLTQKNRNANFRWDNFVCSFNSNSNLTLDIWDYL